MSPVIDVHIQTLTREWRPALVHPDALPWDVREKVRGSNAGRIPGL